jgi:hypothetical protein
MAGQGTTGQSIAHHGRAEQIPQGEGVLDFIYFLFKPYHQPSARRIFFLCAMK